MAVGCSELWFVDEKPKSRLAAGYDATNWHPTSSA
jgi:hypothetical protein